MSLLKLLPITHRMKFKPPVGVLSKGCLARLWPSPILLINVLVWGFSGGSDSNRPQCRIPRFDLWVVKIPWRRMATHSIFLPGEFHRQRSPAGYGPWSHRVEHDWATQTHESFSFSQTCQDCFCLRSFALSICLPPRRFLLIALPIWLVFCFDYKL